MTDIIVVMGERITINNLRLTQLLDDLFTDSLYRNCINITGVNVIVYT
jgi:hypothetical protein